MQYAFAIDQRRCIGCHACTVACKSENEVPLGDFRTWVKYTDVGAFPTVRRHFAVLRCNHCTNAPCVTICPVTALHKRDDGIVDLNKQICIGCKACMQACPYDALYLNEDTGGAEKCHFCAHRVEQGRKPACEVVCPETAIVSGDLHDPQSPVSRLLAEAGHAEVRRPEQQTGPNVYYVGAHAAALDPQAARQEDLYLWSDRRFPKTPVPAHAAAASNPQAVVTLDVDHKLHWGWKVAAYLVTKGISAGAALWAPLLTLLPRGPERAAPFAPELLALVFLLLTNVLLVADLKRPKQFLSIVLRGNVTSWLVKGAYVLIAFGTLTSAVLAARWFGWHALADGLRWTNLIFAALAAGYTAFLFAQCEGRDLWQNQRLLLPHLLVQALLLGGISLLVVVREPVLASLVLLAALLHHGFGLLERFGKHATDNAKLAAALLPTVRAWRGSRFGALHSGLLLSSLAALLALLLVTTGASHPAALALCALTAYLGMFLYERAYVHAGQLPPLS